MKAAFICLALLFAVASARQLSEYCPHYHYEKGYKVVAADGKCGYDYCSAGYYCKRVEELDCKYYGHGKCPAYAIKESKCEAYYTKCGKYKCNYDEKCDVKKVCKIEHKEIPNHGHYTTQEVKTCWDEHVCVKHDGKKCHIKSHYSCCDPHTHDYGSYYGAKYYAVKGKDPKCHCAYGELCIKADVKKCEVDHKYAKLAAGDYCGDKKCGPGYYCKYACKACTYKESAHKKCVEDKYYKAYPCGKHICGIHEYCEVYEKKVCDKKHYGGGYGYKGEHGGYSVYSYEKGYGGYYYYEYAGGSYGGKSHHYKGVHRGGHKGGHYGGGHKKGGHHGGHYGGGHKKGGHHGGGHYGGGYYEEGHYGGGHYGGGHYGGGHGKGGHHGGGHGKGGRDGRHGGSSGRKAPQKKTETKSTANVKATALASKDAALSAVSSETTGDAETSTKATAIGESAISGSSAGFKKGKASLATVVAAQGNGVAGGGAFLKHNGETKKDDKKD